MSWEAFTWGFNIGLGALAAGVGFGWVVQYMTRDAREVSNQTNMESVKLLKERNEIGKRNGDQLHLIYEQVRDISLVIQDFVSRLEESSDEDDEFYTG